MVLGLYAGLPGPRFQVPIPVAEMTKYVDNSFHALKVGFANEIGAICSSLALDSHAVMDIFLADTKLNISTAYLRPGFAFGGSCLPKDVRALTHAARRNDLDVPLLANLLTSNESHMRRAVDLVLANGRHKVGDLRIVLQTGNRRSSRQSDGRAHRTADRQGFHVKIYDATVMLSRLTGANRTYIRQQLPHLGELLTDDVDAVLDHGEVLIIGSREPGLSRRSHGPGGRTGSSSTWCGCPMPGNCGGAPNYQGGIGW